MVNRTRMTVAALIGIIVLVAGCGSSHHDATNQSNKSEQTRTVSTFKGDVKIPTAPKRVVLLTYGLAGYLYRLDLPVIAMAPEVTDQPGKVQAAWADKFAKNGTKFISWPASGFNIEEISAQKPDLIVGGGLGFPNRQASMVYDKLSAIAPTVLVDKKYETWQQQFKYLANEVFNKPEVYDNAVKEYDQRVDEVKNHITLPPQPVSFISMSANKPYVLIEKRGLPAEMERLGFQTAPLFATGKFSAYSAGGDSFPIAEEQLSSVLKQPTLFIIGFNGEHATVDTLRKQPVYAALPAFASGHAYDLPYWVQRADFDRAMATLDVIEKLFPKK